MGLCVAAVGLGGIASKAYLPLLSGRADLELVPCSRSASTVERVQAHYRLPRGTTELDELRFKREGEERVWREEYASAWKPTLEARGFPQQIAHFFECLASRGSPPTSAWEAGRTQQLLVEMVAGVHA